MTLSFILRCWKLQRITRALPLSLSGVPYQVCRKDARISTSSSIFTPFTCAKVCTSFAETGLSERRFSTVAEITQDPALESDLMSFVEAAFDLVKGPHHCWLNTSLERKDFLKKDGIFLVLVSMSVEDLQKAKFLQQRCPWIEVFALQSDISFLKNKNNGLLTQLLIKECIHFPLLLSNKTFPEMSKGPCYILFKDFRSPQLYRGKDIDVQILQRDIKSLHEQGKKDPTIQDMLKSPWSKPHDFIPDPIICSSLRNLLLYYPACISGDETGERFFISDSNHHRIVIFDRHGNILDSIGSFPGFEDGEFDHTRLMRPAGSHYHASEDCLYFVDSENHAIRRADMESRVVETIYPIRKEEEKVGLWTRIVNMLGMGKETETKSDEFDSDALMFPWHLIKSKEDNRLLIMNQSCDALWVMDFDTLDINQVIRGSQNILETYGDIIKEVSAPENLSHNQLQTLMKSFQSSDGLLSSFATSGNDVLVCDKVGHRILRYDTTTDVISRHELSNFGVLGLPYWLSCSLERVYNPINMEIPIDHVQSFTLLPGKVDIELIVEIPSTTVLVEPLQEGCIWRQVRGCAVELSGVENIGAKPDMMGITQQFYDDLDDVVITPEEESSQEEEKEDSPEELNDRKIRIDCCVNTSPGSSEVIIFAALYLKLKKNPTNDCHPQSKAAMIADILKPERLGKPSRDAFIEQLSSSNADLDELVFTKNLHVRVSLTNLDHPRIENAISNVLTDSRIKVQVSL